MLYTEECKYIPALETGRLILRQLLPEDAKDLEKWIGRDEIHTYRGHPASIRRQEEAHG